MAKRRGPQQREPAGRMQKAHEPVVSGARVRELYEAKGWTQQELAWRANLSLPTVSRIVNESHGVSAEALLRLTLCLGTSSDYLLRMTDDPKPRPR